MRKVIFAIITLFVYSATLLADFGAPYGHLWERTYNPPQSRGGVFNDLFLLPNDGIAYCGLLKVTGLISHGWIIETAEDGHIIHEYRIEPTGIGRRSVECFSVIQTDDGGYIVGGKSEARAYDFNVWRFTGDMELEWGETYATQGTTGPCCYAVIELKEGDFIACGQGAANQAMALRLSPGGDIIWQQYYNGTTLYSVREIEEGLAFANYNSNGINSVIQTDFNGALINEKLIGRGIPYSLIRSPDNGYALSGQWVSPQYGGYALELNSQMNINFRTAVNFNDNPREVFSNGYGIASNYDGYLVVGNILHAEHGPLATEFFVDRNGNAVWGKRYDWGAEGRVCTIIRSVVTTPEGGFISCGSNQTGPFAVSYIPVAHKPYFVEISPEDTLISALAGDTLTFSVLAADPDEDEIFYQWRLDEQLVSQDTFATIVFPDLDDYRLVCVISDGVFSDSTEWQVETTNFYISETTPDTFNINIHRNFDIDFRIAARSIVDFPITYQWILSDPWAEAPEVISAEPNLSYHFDHTGMHSLVAIAEQANLSDVVIWRILVEAALARWWPTPPDIRVALDSTVEFGVVPVDSESVEWRIRWTFDDERIGGRRTETITFDQLGIHSLEARVEQNDMVDTVHWYIDVYEPSRVFEQTLIPGSFNCSLHPNPFNQISLIRVDVPQSATLAINLFDANGRFIRTVENRFVEPGRFNISFDAFDLPAGVYILNVNTGAFNHSMKAIILK